MFPFVLCKSLKGSKRPWCRELCFSSAVSALSWAERLSGGFPPSAVFPGSLVLPAIRTQAQGAGLTLPCIPAASFEMLGRICCSLHPPPAEHIWGGWMPPCRLPLRHCLRLLPFCCFTAQLAPHDLFHLVLSEPRSAIIVALKNSGFQYNKVNQYQHCNRWWPLTSFRNFTSFFLLCFSLHLITWSIIPNKNQWDYITTNYC